MNGKIGLAVACALALGAAACSSDNGGSSSSGSGTTTGSTGSNGTGTTGTGSTGGSTGSTGSTSGTTGLTAINGCTPSSAEDHTSGGAVTVNFGGQGGAPALGYAPACIKVTAGTQVTFAGAFANHPLRPGTGCTAAPGNGNPVTNTDSGTSATFTFATAGSFGYFCNLHCSSNQMQGAVYVVQ